jgi:hypothetical protein
MLRNFETAWEFRWFAVAGEMWERIIDKPPRTSV